MESLPPSPSSTFRFVTAVTCALAATTCYNLGPAIQKKVLDRFAPLTSRPLAEQLKTAFGDRRWRTGFLLALSGILPHLASVSLVGVAAAQPLMGFGLVVLAWYGRKYLGERLTLRAAAGIALIVVLPILIAFSRVTAPTRNILHSDTRRALELAVAAVAAACACLVLMSRRASILFAPAAGLLLSTTALCLQVLSQLFSSTGYRLLRDLPVILANLLHDAALLLMVPVALGGIAVGGVAYYLQQIGLQRNRATRFNPILNSVSIAGAVSIGILVFGQRVGRPVLYMCAISAALGGISLLSSSERRAAIRP
jgi:hypothetical protein